MLMVVVDEKKFMTISNIQWKLVYSYAMVSFLQSDERKINEQFILAVYHTVYSLIFGILFYLHLLI